MHCKCGIYEATKSPGTKKQILQGKPSLWDSSSSSANDGTVFIGILIRGLEKHSILVLHCISISVILQNIEEQRSSIRGTVGRAGTATSLSRYRLTATHDPPL